VALCDESWGLTGRIVVLANSSILHPDRDPPLPNHPTRKLLPVESADDQRPWLLRKLHSERYSLSRRVTVEAAVMDFKIVSYNMDLADR
jgi:hypothetical protein